MQELIKIYDSQDYLNNVIIPLSIDVKKVFFLTHDKVYLKQKEAMINFLKRHDIEVIFLSLKDDEKEIKDIFYNHKEAIVDISSNRYLTFFVFEKALKDNRLILYFDSFEGVIKDYRRHIVFKDNVYSLNIEEMIELSGGTLVKNLHEAPDLNNQKLIKNIKDIMKIAIKNYSGFTNYIAKISSILKGRTKTSINSKQLNTLTSSPYYDLFKDLNILRINNKVLYIDEDYKLYMINAGSWLEAYLYITIKESNKFDDCVMSASIDFSDRKDIYPVVCEIDVIVALNNRTAFISCKSNKVDTACLNEIKVHKVMFGTEHSKAVVFTADDLNINNPQVFEKAKELDVAIIDKTSISNDSISLVMEKILKDTYNYEKVVG